MKHKNLMAIVILCGVLIANPSLSYSAEVQTETQTESQTETQTETQTESQISSETESESESESKSQVSSESKSKSVTGKWKTKNKKIYFIKSNGKKATGLTKIGKKTYYFDKKGVQKYGWQKISGSYYYFKIATKSKGYMVKSKTVNNVKLTSSGKAKLTSDSKKKLNVMIKANKLVEKITNPTMTLTKKLRVCFDYTRTKFKYGARRSWSYKKHWEYDYALDMFDYGHGNCFSFNSAFAFMANACGAKNVYCISSGGHGWAEIGGKVYDPDWTLASKVDSYFAMDYSLSGVNGRPNYKKNRTYVSKV